VADPKLSSSVGPGLGIRLGIGLETGSSAQHRTGFCVDPALHSLPDSKFVAPPTKKYSLLLPHSVDDHTSLEFRPHPVPLASSSSSSSAVHSRAPAAAQKSTASFQLFSPLQPPRPRSLSPHTLVLPNLTRLVQPREVQVADPDSSVGPGLGTRLGIGLGVTVGAGCGTELGSGAGVELGVEVGVIVGAKSGSELGDKVGIEFGTIFGSELGSGVGYCVGGIVGDGVGGNVGAVVWEVRTQNASASLAAAVALSSSPPPSSFANTSNEALRNACVALHVPAHATRSSAMSAPLPSPLTLLLPVDDDTGDPRRVAQYKRPPAQLSTHVQSSHGDDEGSSAGQQPPKRFKASFVLGAGHAAAHASGKPPSPSSLVSVVATEASRRASLPRCEVKSNAS